MIAPGLVELAIKYSMMLFMCFGSMTLIINVSEVTNSTILAMSFSVFFLSFALAPLFTGPLSEMYGRRWVRFGSSILVFFIAETSSEFEVLHIGNLLHVVFSVACAYAPSIGSLIAFRFLGRHST